MLSGPPPALAARHEAPRRSAVERALGRRRGSSAICSIGRRPRTGRPSRAGSDRPAAGSTSVTSTSGSSPPDSARVTTLRHGCWRAAIARHRPGPHLFFDPRVIVRELLERAVAQHVDAAVADVRRRRRVVAPTRSAEAVVAIPRRSLRVGDRGGDAPVREPERGLQAVGFEAECWVRTGTARCGSCRRRRCR